MWRQSREVQSEVCGDEIHAASFLSRFARDNRTLPILHTCGTTLIQHARSPPQAFLTRLLPKRVSLSLDTFFAGEVCVTQMLHRPDAHRLAGHEGRGLTHFLFA
ncbi:MAG: hypothetical protein ACI841_004697 [Planctomycetota bacterium]|jgi:hypothetical protein